MTTTSEHQPSGRKKTKYDQSLPFKSNISKFEDLFTPEGLDREFKMTKFGANGNVTTDSRKKMALVCSDLRKAFIQSVLSGLNISYSSGTNKPELLRQLTDSATLIWMLLNANKYHSAGLQTSA